MALDYASPLYSPLGNIITIATALTLVTLVNCNYRIMISISLSTDARQKVTTYHALATETLQGILGLGAMIHCSLFLAATIDEVLRFGSMPPMLEADVYVRVVLSFAYMFAVGLVDFIEAWVVLSQLPQPDQWQCFIITRSVLRRLSHFIREPFARHLRRPRLEEDALIALINRYETIWNLEYLDLVHNFPDINWIALEQAITSTGSLQVLSGVGLKGVPWTGSNFAVAGFEFASFRSLERTASLQVGPPQRRYSCSW